jgi:hypothetical protein
MPSSSGCTYYKTCSLKLPQGIEPLSTVAGLKLPFDTEELPFDTEELPFDTEELPFVLYLQYLSVCNTEFQEILVPRDHRHSSDTALNTVLASRKNCGNLKVISQLASRY